MDSGCSPPTKPADVVHNKRSFFGYNVEVRFLRMVVESEMSQQSAVVQNRRSLLFGYDDEGVRVLLPGGRDIQNITPYPVVL
jgi:hypothetical protein